MGCFLWACWERFESSPRSTIGLRLEMYWCVFSPNPLWLTWIWWSSHRWSPGDMNLFLRRLSQNYWMMNQPQPSLPRRDQNGDPCQRQRNCDGWKARFVSARVIEGIPTRKIAVMSRSWRNLAKNKIFSKYLQSFVEKIDHHVVANAPLLSEGA